MEDSDITFHKGLFLSKYKLGELGNTFQIRIFSLRNLD